MTTDAIAHVSTPQITAAMVTVWALFFAQTNIF
jgi:IMP dehydrogenase/GMP reductase